MNPTSPFCFLLLYILGHQKQLHLSCHSKGFPNEMCIWIRYDKFLSWPSTYSNPLHLLRFGLVMKKHRQNSLSYFHPLGKIFFQSSVHQRPALGCMFL